MSALAGMVIAACIVDQQTLEPLSGFEINEQQLNATQGHQHGLQIRQPHSQVSHESSEKHWRTANAVFL